MDNIDDKLNSIIDKTNNDLHHLSLEYNSQKNRTTTCGPHQKAARNAFHALTRTGNRIKVDRPVVDDDRVSTSRAIDALLDQVLALANGVRDMNRTASSNERRVEGLCHNVEGIDLELRRMKQDITSKASLNDVTAGLESTRRGSALSINAALSPLQAQLKIDIVAAMNEVNDVRATLQKQISDHLDTISNTTLAFQKNLMETMKMVVKEEVKAGMMEIERNSLRVENECGRLISQTIAKAVTEIESNLIKDLDDRIDRAIKEKMNVLLQHEKELIANKIKETITVDLLPMQELLEQTAVKQGHCMAGKKTKSLIKSSHLRLTQSLAELEERLSSSISKKDLMLRSLMNQQDMMRNSLGTFISKNEVCTIAEDKSREAVDRFATVMKDLDQTKASRMQTQLQSFVIRDELNAITNQYQRCIKRIEQLENYGDLCSSLASRINLITEQLGNAVTRDDVDSKGKNLRQNIMREMNDFKSQMLNELESFATKDDACTIAEDVCYRGHEELVTRIESSLKGIESDLHMSKELPRFSNTTSTPLMLQVEDHPIRVIEVPKSPDLPHDSTFVPANNYVSSKDDAEVNTVLNSVASTLSEVAAKRDDASLLQLAIDMHAGCRSSSSQSLDVQPKYSEIKEDVRSSCTDDDVISRISTNDVLSLSGVLHDGEEGNNCERKSDEIELHTPMNKANYAEDEATLPGSVTSFDEEVDFKRNSSPVGCNTGSWDTLLTELKASGLILKD